MKKLSLIYLVVIAFSFTMCSKDSDSKEADKVKDLTIKALSDGFVVNTTPRNIEDSHTGSQGEELRIGWNAGGYAMRAFLTFDISGILPSDDEVLIINSATLKVYESNTNLHPFDSENETREVEVFLLGYGSMEGSDYDKAIVTQCGSIADWGYNILI